MATTSGPLTLSVVTCTYSATRQAQLLALVEALRSQTRPPDEVIVVVDHNPELVSDLRSRLAGIVVTPNMDDRGLSGSRNTGVAQANGDIVAFIDDDAMPSADWLERLAAGYADPRVVGVGGAVDPVWAGGVPRWFPAEFGWVVGCGYAGLPRETADVRNFIGCNMSFRRQAVAAVGGFRIDLGRIGLSPVGCEETEFCIRLIRDRPAERLRFEPGARVRHLVPRSRMTWTYFHSRCYSEGRSKARVAQIAGAASALASERAYVARTLTRAVAHNAALWARGDWWAWARVVAMVSGLATTAFGYAIGRWQLATGRERLAPPASRAVRQS
jgi:glycosyltransferase involved in cell wall biosynthesis